MTEHSKTDLEQLALTQWKEIRDIDDTLLDQIIQELSLSDEQTPVVRGILEASEDERSEIVAKRAGTRGPGASGEAREELDDLRARTEAMLKPLLTDEQMGRYRQIIDRAEAEREQMMEEMRARGPAGPGRGRGRRPGS